MNRRNFLATATTASVALAFVGCNESKHKAIDYSKHPHTKDKKHKNININKNKKTTIKKLPEKNIQERTYELLEEFEKEYFSYHLNRCGGNLSKMARECGMYRANLYQKLEKYGLREVKELKG